jgi:hypothetical protein
MQLNTDAISPLVELTETHFLTTASCINQQMCPIMSLFHDCAMIKVESTKNLMFFCNFLYNIGLLTKGKLESIKQVLRPMQNPPL